MCLTLLVIALLVNSAVLSEVIPVYDPAISDKEPVPAFSSKSFRNALNQQSLQTILHSIEERLRNLDQVYSHRYSNTNSAQCTRKIDMLESKISRLESMFEMQLTKISENQSSKNFKDDIMKDQILRKMDSLYERLNHKITCIEGKFDVDLLKLQTKIESTMTKIDRLDHTISVRQADIETTVSEGVSKIENLKNDITTAENKIVNITKNAFQGLSGDQETINTKVANITQKLEDFQKNLNKTYQKIFEEDLEKNNLFKEASIFMKRFREYEDKINNYGNKMSNMYNELWKKSEILENSIKYSEENVNTTRQEIQNSLATVLKKLENTKRTVADNQNDDSYEMAIESFSNILYKKFAEISRKMEQGFETVMLGQHLFLESCHRIQNEEIQLENKISVVLEKLLGSFMKISSTFTQLNDLEDLIKEHDSNVFHSTNHLSDTISNLIEKLFKDLKENGKILSSRREDLTKTIAKLKENIDINTMDFIDKFQQIIETLHDMQETHNLEKTNGDKTNITIMAQEIISQFISKLDKKISESFENYTLDTIENLIKNMSDNIYDIEEKISKHLDTLNRSYYNNDRTEKTNAGNDIEITELNEFDDSVENVEEVTEKIKDRLILLPDENEVRTSQDELKLGRYNYSILEEPRNNYSWIDVFEIIKKGSKMKMNENYSTTHDTRGGLPYVINNYTAPQNNTKIENKGSNATLDKPQINLTSHFGSSFADIIFQDSTEKSESKIVKNEDSDNFVSAEQAEETDYYMEY